MTSLPIDLPEGFVPLVVENDPVKVDEVIARKDAPGEEIINIMQAFNISRSQARKTLKKGPGEKINPGEVIAVKKNMFGKELATITSSISGTILRYERDTGNLVARPDQGSSSLELISPVAGTVSLCNNKEIVIQTEGALVSEGIAHGITGEGVLYKLAESFEDNSADKSLYYLDSRSAEKIVLVKTLTRDLLIKGDSIGVKGFLGVNISAEDIEYAQQKGISLPMVSITEENIPIVEKWENKKIMIDTADKAIILREN